MHLSFLRPLYERPGPWASVYLDASQDTEQGPKEYELRWQAAADQLRDDGCDESTVEALERALRDRPSEPGRHGVAAFAAAGEVGLVEPMPAPPRAPGATFAPLPHAMPLVAQRGEQVPWLRVVVDHTGADLVGVTAGGVPRTDRVAGTEYPVQKTQPGGWSQPRYQRAAEVSWERHAAEAAEAVAEMAAAIGAEVIVVAGDPQSRPLLVDHLPKLWQDRVVPTDAGSRAAGADPEPLDELTARAVAEVAAAHTVDVLDRYRQQRGREDAAGSGLNAVVAALQRGQVDTVLLIDDPSSTLSLWIGPEPIHLSLDADELKSMGVEQPQQVRADAAIVRAIAGTDASLILVDSGQLDPAELDDSGIGALLRYADASTPR